MLGTIAGVAGLAGTALQVYGGIQSAEANKVAGRYNAAILMERAADVDRVIADVGYVGQLEENDLTEERRQQKSAGRAAFASQNVMLGTGSAGAWEEGLEGTIAQDINRHRANVGRQISQLRSSQQALREEAAFEEWRGESGATAAYVRTGAQALAGATNFAMNQYRMGGY